MILIADSGSTKTDWRLVDDKNKIHQYSTTGFNPYFQDTEFVYNELKNKLIPELNKQNFNPPTIFYYGAGCSTPEKSGIIEKAISKSFPGSVVEINHDLLGAARALCGHKPGIAAILGTGSNSCYYNGKDVVENIPSVGYLFGDEGSGAHIGKTFIKAYLLKEAPASIAADFYERYKLGREEILDAVYKKPLPNRFLASFSKFVYQHIKNQFSVDIVVRCFNEFFDMQICKYSRYKEFPLSSVGSVGFYFSNILKEVAEQRGVKMGAIIETPIAALTLFHTGFF